MVSTYTSTFLALAPGGMLKMGHTTQGSDQRQSPYGLPELTTRGRRNDIPPPASWYIGRRGGESKAIRTIKMALWEPHASTFDRESWSRAALQQKTVPSLLSRYVITASNDVLMSETSLSLINKAPSLATFFSFFFPSSLRGNRFQACLKWRL